MDTNLESLMRNAPGRLLPMNTVVAIAVDVARGLVRVRAWRLHVPFCGIATKQLVSSMMRRVSRAALGLSLRPNTASGQWALGLFLQFANHATPPLLLPRPSQEYIHPTILHRDLKVRARSQGLLHTVKPGVACVCAQAPAFGHAPSVPTCLPVHLL